MTVLTKRTDWLTGPEMLYRISNHSSSLPGIPIKRGELHRLQGDHRWELIYCHEGLLWVTQENDPEDHVLRSRQAFLINQRGLVLVKALRDSKAEIGTNLRTVPFKGVLNYFS